LSAGLEIAEAYAGARVLVFGATGFIGRHLVRALVAAGADLTVSARVGARLDRLTAGAGPAVRMNALDVCDDAAVTAMVGAVRPHITFNLAGYGVDRGERDEAIAERVNGRFPGILCKVIAEHLATDWAGQSLVHAGSQLEYGPIGGNLDERAEPTPHTPYGRTKLEGTRAIERCAAAHALPAITARLFTVFGPGEREGRLLPSIIQAGRTGEPLDLTDGRQRMDFTWVGDVVEGLLRLGVVPATTGARTPAGQRAGTAAENRAVRTSGPASPGMVVNLARGVLVPVREFAEQAADALGVPRTLLRFGALPQRAETLEYEPVTNRRLRALTGWAPATGVTAAIHTMQRGGVHE